MNISFFNPKAVVEINNNLFNIPIQIIDFNILTNFSYNALNHTL